MKTKLAVLALCVLIGSLFLFANLQDGNKDTSLVKAAVLPSINIADQNVRAGTRTPVEALHHADDKIDSAETQTQTIQLKDDPSAALENANQFLSNYKRVASEKKWSELIDLAYALLPENRSLIDGLLLEAAKNDPPEYVLAKLSTMGASLPASSIQYLVGKSSASTLETLTNHYGLDLHYTDKVTGNAFSQAAFSNADADVFDFLIRSGVTLDETGRFEPIQELLAKTLSSRNTDTLGKITKLVEYGATLTNEHFDYAYQFRNYRPEMYALIDNLYEQQNASQNNGKPDPTH